MDELSTQELLKFVSPYYESRDSMHNLEHIGLVIKTIDKIIQAGEYTVDYEALIYAAHFYGVIRNWEREICSWLEFRNMPPDKIEKIIRITSESSNSEIPTTLEGRILHDAHQVEGGKVYFITKCLITGTLKGQTLLETIQYIEENVLHKGDCYLPETKPIWDEANHIAEIYINELKKEIL